MPAYRVHWFDLICVHYASRAYPSSHWIRIACYENQSGIVNLNFALNPTARSFIKTVKILKIIQIKLNQCTQYARIQLPVMAHCLAEMILRRISKHWTNMPYLFGWFIILNVMSDLAANFGTFRSRIEPEQWVPVFTPGRERRLGTSDAQVRTYCCIHTVL